jgi:hypothetical protein
MKRLGWGLTLLFVLFMLGASAAPKLAGAAVATDIMRDLGWPDGYVLMIGLIEVAGTLLCLYPRTGLLGATLLMGLLGGAIATRVRAESHLFGETLFGVYLGLFMWTGLWLRDPKIRAVWPIRR